MACDEPQVCPHTGLSRLRHPAPRIERLLQESYSVRRARHKRQLWPKALTSSAVANVRFRLLGSVSLRVRCRHAVLAVETCVRLPPASSDDANLAGVLGPPSNLDSLAEQWSPSIYVGLQSVVTSDICWRAGEDSNPRPLDS